MEILAGVILMGLGLVCGMISVFESHPFEDYSKGESFKVPLCGLLGCVLMLIGFVTLASGIHTSRNSPQTITARQQAEMQALQEPALVQIWGGVEDYVAFTDKKSIPGTNLSQVTVERQSDKHLFTVLAAGPRKIKKGDTVRLLEVIYAFDSSRVEKSFVIAEAW